jgi:hypothetical protein
MTRGISENKTFKQIDSYIYAQMENRLSSSKNTVVQKQLKKHAWEIFNPVFNPQSVISRSCSLSHIGFNETHSVTITWQEANFTIL